MRIGFTTLPKSTYNKKVDGATEESWTDWIMNTINPDDKGKHQVINNEDEDDNPIGDDDDHDNDEHCPDDEDM